MKLNQKPCINTRKVINKEKRSKALSEVKPVQGCAMQRMGGGRFFWNLSVFLTKCVEKFPDLMLSINLEYIFFDKK